MAVVSKSPEKWLGGMDPCGPWWVGSAVPVTTRSCSPAGSELLKHVQWVVLVLHSESKFPDNSLALLNWGL